MKNIIRYIYPLIYMAGDISGIFLGLYLAYRLRFSDAGAAIFPITKGIPELGLYLYATIYVCIIWIFMRVRR